MTAAAAKPQQPPPSSTTARRFFIGSLLAVAFLALVFVTYISLNPLLQFPLHHNYDATSSIKILISPLLEFSDLFGLNYADLEKNFKEFLDIFRLNYAETEKNFKNIAPAENDFEEFSNVYNAPEVFRLNYAMMEKNFKVYVYPDGDSDTYYHMPRTLDGKYASEGYFFQNIRESQFRTDDPEQADLFFIPISCHKMREKGNSYENMTTIVQNYVESLIAKYPYWNRTLGADHFFVTCHDVGVRATEGLPFLVKNSIRVVCNPTYDAGFIPHKDVALPQVLQPFYFPAGGNDVENRTILGFWRGYKSSNTRVELARQWKNDTELDICNNTIHMSNRNQPPVMVVYRTKFCICPRGSEVNSIRVTISIHYGCIPVILSDYYDLPFNDILDWKKFSVILKENDVYQLKQILKDIPEAEFVALHNNLVKVQKHFRWNSPPIRFDAFHMTMYELWLRRHVIRY